MFDFDFLGTFKIELTSIVNSLAMSVVTETISNADKCYLNKEKRGAFVDDLCRNAINKICKIVELSLATQRDAVSECRSKLSVPPSTDAEAKEDIKLSQPAEGGLKLTNISGQSQLEAQTYILIYGSAVIDAKYPLSTDVLEICDNGVNKHGATEGEDERKTQHSEDSSSPAPLTPAECLDHEYALPSSLASISATKEKDCSTAARNKKRPRSRRKKNAQHTTAEKLKKLVSTTEHECKRCRRLFPNIQQLEDHKKRKHLDCKVCGVEFSGIVKLREHLVDVHQLMPFSCDYCDKTFNHKTHYNLHVRTHTGEKTCYCDICGKGYSCISILKAHRMTHFEKTFICDLCGKGFYYAGHLKRHKHVHKEVRPFGCDICGKGFNQAENLKKHKITHTGEKHLCAICGKSYRCLSSHMINRHSHDIATKKVPLNKNIITCEVCGKKYLHASQYKLHKMTHTGEKPYHCDICGKSYRLKDALKDHKYIHTGERPYKCTTCGKTFPSTPSYKRHMSIHTGEMPYHCKECGKRFRLLTFLKAHQKTQGHLKQKMKDASADNSLEQADSST